MNNYDFIKIGNKVFWHDPDGGLSDGVYQVVDVPEEIEEDSIILIVPPILLYDLWKIYLLYLSNITFFYTHL